MEVLSGAFVQRRMDTRAVAVAFYRPELQPRQSLFLSENAAV